MVDHSKISYKKPLKEQFLQDIMLEKKRQCCEFCECEFFSIHSHLETKKRLKNVMINARDDLFGKSWYEDEFVCKMCDFHAKKSKVFSEHLLSLDHFQEFHFKYICTISREKLMEELNVQKSLPREHKIGAKNNGCHPEIVYRNFVEDFL